jgi:hypothetical protein
VLALNTTDGVGQESTGRALAKGSSQLHRPLTIAPDHQAMDPAPHSSSPRLPLMFAGLFAALFLAGCSGANEPVPSPAGVVSGTAPSTATTATTSTAPAADITESLAGIDRALAELDHQLTDADHHVAIPEGDIR